MTVKMGGKHNYVLFIGFHPNTFNFKDRLVCRIMWFKHTAEQKCEFYLYFSGHEIQEK